MPRAANFLIVLLVFFSLTGCHEKVENIEFISISFPLGESDLRVWRHGEARLYYGSLPQSDVIRKGTFSIAHLYDQIRPLLHPNMPREDWPNPNAICGMVQIEFKGKIRKDYLIFDEQEFAQDLFNKARQNIIRKDF